MSDTHISQNPFSCFGDSLLPRARDRSSLLNPKCPSAVANNVLKLPGPIPLNRRSFE